MVQMTLDHLVLGTPNIYWTAERLRDLTGLAAIDGGWFPRTGVGARVVPLPENDQFILIESVIDMDRAQNDPFAMWFHGVTRQEALVGWVIRVASMAELEELARRYSSPVVHFKGLRVWPDGSSSEPYGVVDTPVAWPKALPNFIFWDKRETMHPARRPADHRIRPGRIAWLEYGDEDHRLRDWLGRDIKQLPEIRILPKGIGPLAAGIAVRGGKVAEIRPPIKS